MPATAPHRALPQTVGATSDMPDPVAPALFDYALLCALAALPPAPTITVLLSTHRAERDRPADLLRVYQLLQEGRHRLAALIGETRAGGMILPALRAVGHPRFWRQATEGLALFCREGEFHYAWLPAAVPALVSVGEHPAMKTLLPLLQGNGIFYLLTVQADRVHLFSGSRFVLHPILLPGFPAAEDRDAVAALPSTVPKAIPTDARLRRLFGAADTAVCELLHAQHTPLLLVGEPRLLQLYTAENHYPHLLAEGITQNPRTIGREILHAQAWGIVAPLFSTAISEAHQRMGESLAHGQASTDLAHVLDAAVHGRIEEMFVASDRERRGLFHAASAAIREAAPGEELAPDLLDSAVRAALATGSRVEVVPHRAMPGQGDIAATFRY